MDALKLTLLLSILCACCFLAGWRLGRGHTRKIRSEKFGTRLFDGGFNAYVHFGPDVPPGDMLRFIDAIRPVVELCEDELAAKRRTPGA